MSAGVFINATYRASYGAGTAIHPIRIQPETEAATIGSVDNARPVGAQTNPIQARVSGSKRSIGLIARSITIQAPATGQPTGYKPLGITRIPALTQAFYDAATKGETVTYLGVSYTVVSRSLERVDGSN